LASCSLYLQAEQSNDILKLKESHKQPPPYFATVANISQESESFALRPTGSIHLSETPLGGRAHILPSAISTIKSSNAITYRAIIRLNSTV
jgi:hypothetical protein